MGVVTEKDCFDDLTVIPFQSVFAGFFNNGLFLFIAGLTFIVQIAMVNYGG